MKYDRLLYTGLIAGSCFTSLIKADSGFEAKTHTSSKGESLNYRIHVPANLDVKQHVPLILFLHGAGERGNDNNKQLFHGVKAILAYSKKSNTPSIIVAPQCPAGAQWVNTPWGADVHTMPAEPSTSMLLTMGLLQKLQTRYSIDPSRIYVTGISMGGFGTWDIIQRMPETFAAAMPVCGGGDTHRVNSIKQIPIWAFHGGSDPIVKVTRSRDMVVALQKVGGHVKYTEYEGVKHDSWSRTYADEKTLAWLLSQRKCQ